MAEMNLLLHPDQVQALARNLSRADLREIGGVLVGEHVSEDRFRLVDLSFQRSPGTASCFVRRPEQHQDFFNRFFERTGRDFQRFNYLGEWHSHPTFSARPSHVDDEQMHAIVDTPADAPLFAVLVIVRLARPDEIEMSAFAYQAGGNTRAVTVHVVPRPHADPAWSPPPCWRRILTPRTREVRLKV